MHVCMSVIFAFLIIGDMIIDNQNRIIQVRRRLRECLVHLQYLGNGMVNVSLDLIDSLILPRTKVSPFEILGLSLLSKFSDFNEDLSFDREMQMYTLTQDEHKKVKRAYYAAISYVDDLVGDILSELRYDPIFQNSSHEFSVICHFRSLGLSDNTIIVFTSDHGFHIGDHGHWGKNKMFALSTRVPLIVKVHEKILNTLP